MVFSFCEARYPLVPRSESYGTARYLVKRCPSGQSEPRSRRAEARTIRTKPTIERSSRAGGSLADVRLEGRSFERQRLGEHPQPHDGVRDHEQQHWNLTQDRIASGWENSQCDPVREIARCQMTHENERDFRV